jgi:hypothetical protein
MIVSFSCEGTIEERFSEMAILQQLEELRNLKNGR